jgi:ABC-type nitrate/sulfonate/bicarbonate transport system substrate-binding protein
MAGESLATAVAGLKGGSVNAPSLGGTGGRQVQTMATAYGLSTKDVQLVADPTNASLTAGKVKASMTDTVGACRLTALGYPELMNFVNPPADKSSYPAAVQSLIGLAGLGYWSNASWADQHAGAVTGFQKAIEQATTWAKDPANASAVATLLRKSDFNVSALTDSQWSDCVKQGVAAFSNKYTSQDAATWKSIVTSSGIASTLPPTSEWLASGLPQS